jgi:hypothetical protein
MAQRLFVLSMSLPVLFLFVAAANLPALERIRAGASWFLPFAIFVSPAN